MKGFTLSGDARSYLPCSYTVSENSTICGRLRRIFKGPSPQTPKREWKDEKPYHHVPTHAGASFMKTATNPAMLPHLKNANQESITNGNVEGRQPDAVQGSLI